MTMHLQIAEAGKCQMLDGNYREALDRFRTALRMARQQGAPDVFMAHYIDCLLDCLELSGDHEQILAIVECALDDRDRDAGAFSEAVRVSLVVRRVLVLYTLGRLDDGDVALGDAADIHLPVMTALRDARRRQLTPTVRWIEQLKRRHTPSAVTEHQLRRLDADHGEQLFQKEYRNG